MTLPPETNRRQMSTTTGKYFWFFQNDSRFKAKKKKETFREVHLV